MEEIRLKGQQNAFNASGLLHNRRRRRSGRVMATADSGVKPLQNAMKMAKVAIQLDGGNKHKVVR